MNPTPDRINNGENIFLFAKSTMKGIISTPINPIPIINPKAWLLISVGNTSG